MNIHKICFRASIGRLAAFSGVLLYFMGTRQTRTLFCCAVAPLPLVLSSPALAGLPKGKPGGKNYAKSKKAG